MNCDQSVVVQNDNNTYRFFSSIVDFDGSVTGITGGAVIGGSSPHWSIASDCYFNAQWFAYICPRNAQRDVVSLSVVIPSYLEPNQPSWPAGFTAASPAFSMTPCGRAANKVDVQFQQQSVTGLSGEGWFFTFPGQPGSPKSIKFGPRRIDPAYKAIVVLAYPAGTTFSINWTWDCCPTYGASFTAVGSIAEVKSMANTLVYYWNSATNYLYVGIQPPNPVSFFRAGGVALPGFDNAYGIYINIVASCTPNAAGFCTTSTVVPPSINA